MPSVNRAPALPVCAPARLSRPQRTVLAPSRGASGTRGRAVTTQGRTASAEKWQSNHRTWDSPASGMGNPLVATLAALLGCDQSVVHILSSVTGLMYSVAAENIAWMSGNSDPLIAADNLMNVLMNSPGYWSSLLDPRFTHIGIGSSTTAVGQTGAAGGHRWERSGSRPRCSLRCR